MDIITPIQKIHGQFNDSNIYIKRDDLLPLSFGGNKVRIAQEYFNDMLKNGCNCMIGYGSIRSNLCRVLSNLCAMQDIPCYIVSPRENGERTNNTLLIQECGANICYCSKDRVAEAVETTMKTCERNGLKPYYINGNKYGEGNEAIPVRAYVKGYQEILEQSRNAQEVFDYIFLPTGTGMTQAGLLEGQKLYGGKEKIVGISIARESSREKEIIEKFIKAYEKQHSIISSRQAMIEICDDYLCGGYGKYNKGIAETITFMLKKHSIALDYTYTGKAFWGMIEYLRERNIVNKNILFLHTGGLPLFFDFLRGEGT